MLPLPALDLCGPGPLFPWPWPFCALCSCSDPPLSPWASVSCGSGPRYPGPWRPGGFFPCCAPAPTPPHLALRWVCGLPSCCVVCCSPASGCVGCVVWQRDVATIRWFLPEGRDTQLRVAHWRKGRPQYDDDLSRLGGLPGPLLLMPPSNLATALSRELKDYAEVRVDPGAVADSTLLVLFHRAGACWHQRDALFPQLKQTAPHLCVRPPWSTPAQSATTTSRPTKTMGCTPPTRGRRSGRKHSAETTGAASAPASWSFRTPCADVGTSCGSASSAPGTQTPTSSTLAFSAGRATRCPPPRQQVYAVLPGGRVPLAGATGGGGTATALGGRPDPLAGPCGA